MITNEIQTQVDELLANYPNMPCKAFIAVLKDTTIDPAVALGIVTDPRCGIERKATLAEEGMKRKNGQRIITSNGGATPLILATIAGRADIVEMLLTAGADVGASVDVEGYTALHLSEHFVISELLMNNGADLDAGDFRLNTPLHDAATLTDIEVIEMLVAEGANITLENAKGYTPYDSFEDSWYLGELAEEDEERIRALLTPN